MDFTIADFVADVRAPTPSAAAEMVAAASAELSRRVDAARRSLHRTLSASLAERRHQLEQLRSRRGLALFGWRLQTLAQRVDDLRQSLSGTMRERLARCSNQPALLSQRLAAASPVVRVRALEHRRQLAGHALALIMQSLLRSRRSRWEVLRQAAVSLDPRGVLQRGYALCLDSNGQVVRSYRQQDPGSAVCVLLQEGMLDCRVEAGRPDDWPRRDQSTR